jgi:hypothetical protein
MACRRRARRRQDAPSEGVPPPSRGRQDLARAHDPGGAKPADSPHGGRDGLSGHATRALELRRSDIRRAASRHLAPAHLGRTRRAAQGIRCAEGVTDRRGAPTSRATAFAHDRSFPGFAPLDGGAPRARGGPANGSATRSEVPRASRARERGGPSLATRVTGKCPHGEIFPERPREHSGFRWVARRSRATQRRRRPPDRSKPGSSFFRQVSSKRTLAVRSRIARIARAKALARLRSRRRCVAYVVDN